MKTLLLPALVITMLGLTSCAKENLSVNPETSPITQKTKKAQRTADIGFDDEVLDNPIQIKTSLTYYSTSLTKRYTYSTATNYFNGDYSNSVISPEDVPTFNNAYDPDNLNETLSILNSNFLTEDRHKLIAAGHTDSIKLYIQGYHRTTYFLKVDPLQFVSGITLQLIDQFQGTTTNLSTTTITYTAINVSYPGNNPDRFILVVGR